MLDTLIDYHFKNENILESVNNDEQYYRYLGYQLINSICAKSIYDWFSYTIDDTDYLDIDYNNANVIISKIKSKEYLLKCSKKLDLNCSVLTVIGGVYADSNDDRVVENVARKLLFLDEMICQKNYYIMLKKWCKRRNVTSFNYTYDGNELYITIDEYNLRFVNNGKTLFKALNLVSEEVCRYLVSKKMFFKVKDVAGNFNYDNAYELLNKLSADGYFNTPKYEENFHDDGYEVKCSISDYSFYFIIKKSNLDEARRSAALGMLDLIVSQES